MLLQNVQAGVIETIEENTGFVGDFGFIWAVKYFWPYILGHYTTVFTDLADCISLLNNSRLPIFLGSTLTATLLVRLV